MWIIHPERTRVPQIEFYIACRLSNHAQYRLSACMEIEWNILFYRNPLNRKASGDLATPPPVNLWTLNTFLICFVDSWIGFCLHYLFIPYPGIDDVSTLCGVCMHLVCQTFNFTWNHIIFFFHFLLFFRFCVEIIFNFSDAVLYPTISDNIEWIFSTPVHHISWYSTDFVFTLLQ